MRRTSVLKLWALLFTVLLGVASPAQAQHTLRCGNTDAYSLDLGSLSPQNLRHITVGSTSDTVLADMGTGWNGLAVSVDGSNNVYMSNTATGAVKTYNTFSLGSSTSAAPTIPVPHGSFITGGINPVNGYYYSAAPLGAPSGDPFGTQWALYRYTGGPGAPVRIGTITTVGGNNGDLAFDALGNLYLLSGNRTGTQPRIYRINASVVNAGTGTASLMPGTAITAPMVMPGTAGNFAGIAFVNGRLIAQLGDGGPPAPPNTTYTVYNPATGAQIPAESFTNRNGGDLASCQGAYTVQLRKNLPQGRVAAAHQFGLAITTIKRAYEQHDDNRRCAVRRADSGGGAAVGLAGRHVQHCGNRIGNAQPEQLCIQLDLCG